ncbi:MAG TPA: NAD(P)H-dependent oxidoreductase [Selenomonadales bacterium]|nr:NAD(P)H-dependent oxidoreductase [Selenomonadales bacterium]
MRVVVLNGSPKGAKSVTMQYLAFWQKLFPEHEWDILHVAQRVKQLERDEAAWAEVVDSVRGADFIVWAFPVYVLLVPAQYKRFIELLLERAEEALAGKPAAAVTTSIRFFDHTAHSYIRSVSEDLGMPFYGGYSAAVDDLFQAGERDRFGQFGRHVLAAAAAQAPVPRVSQPLPPEAQEYRPAGSITRLECGDKRVAVVIDQAQDSNLARMVSRFTACLAGEVEVFELQDVDIKGGCLGCIRCGYNNQCVYEGRDGFVGFHQKLKKFDILVFAGAIRDRYLSSAWKTFFDRSFYTNHIPFFTGKQMAFLISGPLGKLADLRQILEAHAELQQANLAGIVTDEAASAEIDSHLQGLAADCLRFARAGFVRPPSFLGTGGRKIFRDEIWGKIGFPFVADYRYYQTHGLFDFPHNDWRARLYSRVMRLAVTVPAVRRAVYSEKIPEAMITPYRNLLKKL